MTMHPISSTDLSVRPAGRRRRRVPRLACAAALGALAAVLVSCGSSGKSLIPVANAGPLLSDFEAVRQAAESANGNCSATEAALRKTEEDFAALPSTVDAGLRNNLRQGVSNLRVRAHEMCAQPVVQPTVSTTAPRTTTTTPTTTTTTPADTQTTPTQTTSTTTTPTAPGPEGGTPAPGAGEAPAAPGGGTGAGESGGKSPGAGAGAGGVGDGQGQGHGQEAGK